MALNAKLDLKVFLYLMILESPSSDGEQKQLIINGLHSCSKLLGDSKSMDVSTIYNSTEISLNFLLTLFVITIYSLLRTLLAESSKVKLG